MRILAVLGLLAAIAILASGAHGATTPSLHAGSPAWSPDGRWLAFSANPAGPRSDIYVVRRDGTHLTNVTAADRATIHDLPAWSRDGRRIAFVTQLDDCQQPLFDYSVVSRDGGPITRKVRSTVRHAQEIDYFQFRPSVTTNGRVIATRRESPAVRTQAQPYSLTTNGLQGLGINPLEK